MTMLLGAGQIFVWLATTKIGRIVAGVAGALLLLFILYMKVKAIGRAEERAKTEAEIRKHKETKDAVDSRVGGLSDSDVDRELRKWTQH